MSAASVWLLCVCVCVRASAALEFYPYGPAYDAELPRQNDVSSLEIPLAVSVKFFGETYNSIFVNSNGLLSFLTEIPMFFSIQFPLNYPIIAPLYANVDTTGKGQVYYRETQDPELLQRFNSRVASLYPNLAQPFSARSLFIASWIEVGYHPRGTDKVNTFQVVVASDGTETFAELLYRQGGVQWVQGQGVGSRLPDARAQAGFVAEDGRLYTLRGSGTDQIQNLDRWSNSDEPGDWLFRIGNTGPTGNVEPPQISSSDNENLVEDVTCRTGATSCHSRAECQDAEEGFCCVCQPGYYGNGRTCLPDQIPLRVNGKVTLALDGAQSQEVDVQAYVVTADGRCYTALSRVPPSVGNSAQLITSISDLVGWLFAKSINNAPNGYMLTGGVLNHSAVLRFADGQHTVAVEQQFLGLDVFDQLRLEGKISGSLPQVPHGYKLSLPDTQIQFRKLSNGLVRSQSTYVVYVEGSVEQFPVSVEQTISFNEYCPSSSTEATYRLKAARNFISYEETENILRYAATNKISSLSDNDDPCVVGQVSCVNNSYCIPEGSTFRCVCKNGFQTLYSDESTGDYGCVDINECQSGSHSCDTNALCINEVGSFTCQCKPGFTGNGYSCQELPEVALDCSGVHCNPGAECIVSEDGPRCFCIPGFTSDGNYCIPNAEDDCLMCSPHAWCNRTHSGQVECTCLPGYVGSGRECAQAEGTVEQTCLLGECWCPSGYVPQGKLCINDTSSAPAQPQPETSRTVPVSCNIANNCHPQAQCIYLHSEGAYECVCNSGFEGDGYECSEIELSCKEADICDLNAICMEEENSDRAICVCNEGYQGDGTSCQKSVADICTEDVECGDNAVCIYSEENLRKECECNPGYVLDYKICIKQECDECHRDAACMAGPGEVSQCVCRSGFVGDGVEKCEPQATGCNVHNNCARDAECVFMSDELGYQCQCRQGFEGNGLECQQSANCVNTPSLCDKNAHCVAASTGYECQCQSGYIGNGHSCKEVVQREGGFLLVNKGMATVRIPMEPTKTNPGRPIQLQYDQIAIGLAVDCVDGLVYWSDIAGQVIKTSSLGGKDIQTFINKDVSSPEGLAVDWVARKLYWTDSSKDVIKAANLDTKEVETIVSTGLINPRGIAVHPTRRKVFWSDWNRAAPKLESINLDGTGRKVLVTQNVQLPNSLAIDWFTQELCWTDAGTKKIECLHLDSFSRRTVVSNCSYPFGLTITDDKYYWTDWQTQKVESVYKVSSVPSESLTVPLGGSGKLYGIAAVTESCPRV